MFFFETSPHVLVQHVIVFLSWLWKRMTLFSVSVSLFCSLCVEWPLKVTELNSITPCQPPLGRKQLQTKIRLQKTWWEKLEEHHTCVWLVTRQRWCNAPCSWHDLQVLDYVGNSMLTYVLFLQYVHCEQYANLKYAVYRFCAGILYLSMQCTLFDLQFSV